MKEKIKRKGQLCLKTKNEVEIIRFGIVTAFVLTSRAFCKKQISN